MADTAKPLTGKIAIVTGAGRGIGRSIARRLAASGARVVLASRTESQLDETRKLIERDGGQATAIPTDVSNPTAVEQLIDAVARQFGRLDILVNNAGVAPNAPIEKMSPETFDQLLAANIRAIYTACRTAWPHLKRAGGGTIINISSMSASAPFPGFAAYGGTKAFVNTYSEGLAAEGAPHRIRVYAVAPGAVETGMLRGLFPDYPKERTLEPDDVAAVVEMLCLPAAAPMSGQTLTVQKP